MLRGGSRQNLLVDGDMEGSGTAAWTPGNAAVLTKDTTNPRVGTQCLRIAYNGTSNPLASNSMGALVAGRRYRLTGWMRGDGTVLPGIYCGSWLLFGTNSTSWQLITVSILGVASSIGFFMWGSSGFVEYDDLRLIAIGG
jgi:hypothetical protein